MNLQLGIGEYGIVEQAGHCISAHALGSCVSLIIQDLSAQVVGMAHVVLPDSRFHTQRAQKLPGYFADTGLLVLEAQMKEAGALKSEKGLRISLVGGARVLATNSAFNIGQRNLDALQALLSQRGWALYSADTGGYLSRTVMVQRDDGLVTVSSPGKPPQAIVGVQHG